MNFTHQQQAKKHNYLPWDDDIAGVLSAENNLPNSLHSMNFINSKCAQMLPG